MQFSKSNVSSFQNARGFTIDNGVFTDVAGNSNHSIAGFVVEGSRVGGSNVHIDNINVGDQLEHREGQNNQYVFMSSVPHCLKILQLSSYPAE